jgi:hypothetical protein
MSGRVCAVDACERPRHRRDWCVMHHSRWKRTGNPLGARTSPDVRFWAKVDKRGPMSEHRPDLGACWVWTGGKDRLGYGHFWLDRSHVLAHRFAYELLVGPIAGSLEMDHLCRVRHCVNPHHLEQVTHRVNTLRGTCPSAQAARVTHCPQGHAYNEENTRIYQGRRYCRECSREASRRYKASKRAERE